VVKYNDTYKLNVKLVCDHIFNMVFERDISKIPKSALNLMVEQLSINFPELVNEKFISKLENNTNADNIQDRKLNNCIPLLFYCPQRYKEQILKYLVRSLQLAVTNEAMTFFVTVSECICSILSVSDVSFDKSVVFLPVIESLAASSIQMKNEILENLICVSSSSYKNLSESQQAECLSFAETFIIQRIDSNIEPLSQQVVAVIGVSVIGQAERLAINKMDVKTLLISLQILMMEVTDEELTRYIGLVIASLVNKIEGMSYFVFFSSKFLYTDLKAESRCVLNCIKNTFFHF